MEPNDKKTVLYLGLDSPPFYEKGHVIHYPIIQIVPRQPSSSEIVASFSQIPLYTHFIFTSKSAVKIFAEFLLFFEFNSHFMEGKVVISVGNKTADYLQKKLIPVTIIATHETSEGIIQELNKVDLSNAYVFWPHSALSRPLIKNYLNQKKIPHSTCIIYDTFPLKTSTLPDLSTIDEIVFTSPSCVKAFILAFGSLPLNKVLTPIGPITALELTNVLGAPC
jgi:uroporphyrinogen-III synthase